MDVFFSPFFGLFDFTNHRVQYWGDAHTPLDLTTRDDAAQYVVAELVSPKAINATLRIAGEVTTLNKLITTYEAVKGVTLQRTVLGSLDELRAWITQTKQTAPSK